MNYTDLKVGAGVSAATIGTGGAKWMQMIPDDIGKIGVLLGSILTIVLIVVHLRKMKHDAQAAELARVKIQLEIDELRAKQFKPPQ